MKRGSLVLAVPLSGGPASDVASGAVSQVQIKGDPIEGVVTTAAAAASIAEFSSRYGGLTCLLTLAGSASLESDGRVHFVHAHSLIWSALHRPLRVLDQTPEFSGWLVWYSEQLLARVLVPGTRMFQSLQNVCGVPRLATSDVRALNQRFLWQYSQSGQPSAWRLELEQLLAATWGGPESERPENWADVHPAVEKAVFTLRSQPETPSMRNLAKECGASASWLSRLFREQLGISLVGFRNQSRIERFFQLYAADARHNLTQAALNAGFGSYAQFHRVFKETVGCSPAALKRGASGLRQDPPASG